MTSKENVFNNIDNVGSSTKFVAVKFLTSETVYFGIEKKCKVNELFSKVCVHLGLADCAELFGLAIRQFNCPTSIFGTSTNSNYYSASQVEESIKQDDSQFVEEYIFLNPNEKISKYTSKHWKNSKNGLDPLGKAYLQCFFRVQFYIDSYLFLTDRIARHHYYLQLKQNVINYNLANLTLERAFLLASLALQAERGNYNDNKKYNYQQKPTSSTSILNSTFINNENYNLFNQQDQCYFDPYEYMPKWIIDQMGENYIIENMPTMHKENENISKIDSEIMFIKEASEICPHNLHMYRLYKTNPSTFSKKLVNNVNNHFNALFHGHHFNSSINSNSSTITNHSSIISNNNSNLSNHSILSNNSKEGKIWLGICATGVQIYDMDCINKSTTDFNPSMNSDLQLKEKYQDQLNNVCYLRSKLSTFNWSDIEKLFFDKKKFEIRSNGYPSRRFTYFAASDEMAKNLLWLCKFSHRFQLFIQPKLKEMKKRENEFARRKYRESYIYSEEDNKLNQSNDYQIKLKTENWIEYQNEPMNKYLYFNNIKQSDQNSSLSTSRNTLVDRESLNASQNYHLSPLSRDMRPIMEKFDRQISKLQFNNDLEDSSSSSSNNQHPTVKSIDQVDYLESLKNYNNQTNTNPFLDKNNYDQLNYHLFNQSQQHQIENLDEFVIEHRDDNLNKIQDKISNNHSNACLNKLTVQPLIKEISNINELNENKELNNQNLIIRLNEEELINNKSNKQTTFSLESLTCSALSEPSSSGISEQEFSTGSCASGNGNLNEHKNNNSLCNQINYTNHHLIHPNTESPNSEQSRCSSNTSYSSDSALSKCSKQQTKSIPQKLVLNNNNNDSNKNFTSQPNCIQKLKHYAFSANDLHKQFNGKDDYYKAINDLEKDYQLNQQNIEANNFNQTYHNNQIPPKPKARKSKFEMKNKNKSNIMYKSLPNVNNFNCANQFGKLDLINDEDNLLEKERFNFLNGSNKSTSSEQSVSTIKSNDKTNSSTKLNENNNNNNDNRLNELIEKKNLKFNKSDEQNNWYQLGNFEMKDTKIFNETNLDSIKIGHTYENLPFQKQMINNNLLNCNRTPITNSFLPAPNLTPNRIATKIGISSLNRCNNKINSAQKNQNQNFKLNLLNSSLDRPNLRSTCSYQLLNYEINNSTISSNPLYTPFKTTRTSSDPGVLTYSSTNNLSKIPIEDSINFYRNLTSKFSSPLQQTQTSNFNRINNSLNNINDINMITNNLAYDQPLINQISNQRKNLTNRKNQNYPLRLAESEMNLISGNTSDHCSLDSYNSYIPPPSEYSDNLEKLNKHPILNSAFKNQLINGKLKATSEQKLNLNNTDSIEKLKQKTNDLDLPMINQLLFNDRSLILPKTVPTTSRQKHQKPNRYSLENKTTSSDLKLSPSSLDNNFKQTNLDDSIIFSKTYETNLDSSLIMKNQLKYDNNYNNLESNNLNKLSSPNLPLNNRSKIVDEIFEHLLN